jgi:hypothetical protein
MQNLLPEGHLDSDLIHAADSNVTWGSLVNVWSLVLPHNTSLLGCCEDEGNLGQRVPRVGPGAQLRLWYSLSLTRSQPRPATLPRQGDQRCSLVQPG